MNRSSAEFTVADGKICFGLSAIKGCGGAAAEAIVAERDGRRARIRSLFDFCERLDPGTVNRTAIESLIKAGAFDSLGGQRAQLFAAIDRALQAGAAAAADRRSGQKGLFGDDDDEPAEAGRRRPARPARVGRTRTAGQGKGSAGLLPVQPSAGRARADAGGLLLAHHGRGGRAEAPHRSDARRHARRRSSSRTRRTPSRAAPAATPCSTWKTPTASCAASSGPSSSPATASWSSPTRSSSSAARSTSGPAAKKPT